jgi:hypothetical protein
MSGTLNWTAARTGIVKIPTCSGQEMSPTSHNPMAGASVPLLARTADRYFGPAAGLTLLTGILLVLAVDPWGWTDAFVLVGLGVFLFSAIWQPLVANKVQARLLGALAGEGDTGQALSAFHRSAAVDVAILVVAVWAMVSKLGY